MLVGYARTSTVEQIAGLDAQLDRLNTENCEKVFSERVGSATKREQLEDALDFVRGGDVLIVTKLDRLARSIADLVDINRRLEAKSVTLKVLDLNLDTSTPTGRLMQNMLGSIAQFERELMLERLRQGIARAKAEGKYKGRAPTARAKSRDVKAMRDQGVKPKEIAGRLGISRASVYRVLSTS